MNLLNFYDNIYIGENMRNKRYKLKWKNIFFLLTLLIFIIIFITSIYNVIKWKAENKNINDEIKQIYDKIKVDETIDNEDTKIIEPIEPILPSDPYWDYIKMNLIDVDFNSLKSLNSDTVGWLKVNGTNINYPFVQYKNNEYYLTHSFDKKYNKAGWVFVDYRNNLEELDKNTIIYAHGRLNNTMFGSLKNIVKSDWYENQDNHIIKISTEHQNTLWQVFSVYVINTTSDYLKVSFNDTIEFEIFANMLMNRSEYNFKTKINRDDKIVTLSTCYNSTKKVVMHAKLIKIEKK